jgi:sorting nexin-9/18/33
MSRSAAKAPPASSLAAFLTALSWTRLRTARDPDFDAGLNSSSAWTESLSNPAEGILRTSVVHQSEDDSQKVNSLSDDEDEVEVAQQHYPDERDELPNVGQAARALFAFEGKPEFRELTSVQAGDRLEVLREDVGDGWSLVRYLEGPEEHPEVGLLPQTYYTV